MPRIDLTMSFEKSSGQRIDLRKFVDQHPEISHVVFDFDGTLSWLRHGWPELMFDVFRPFYPVQGESDEAIHDFLVSEILSLNGKPSIFQMLRFAELVSERGGSCPEPERLLHDYQNLLDRKIVERSQRVRSGECSLDEYVVYGARAFLDFLRPRRVTLIVLSGTIEHRVKEEASLLGLSHFFGRHIYGSTPDGNRFSKRDVIDRLLREESIEGRHLLSFGDGPVELRETRAVGGIAIGIASDENENGSGQCDPHKRRILFEAGAELVLPDYGIP